MPMSADTDLRLERGLTCSLVAVTALACIMLVSVAEISATQELVRPAYRDGVAEMPAISALLLPIVARSSDAVRWMLGLLAVAGFAVSTLARSALLPLARLLAHVIGWLVVAWVAAALWASILPQHGLEIVR